MKPIEIYRAEYEDSRYETFVDDYRWRIKSRNGKIIAASSEGFSSRAKCRANLKRLMAVFGFNWPDAFDNEIHDLTAGKPARGRG